MKTMIIRWTEETVTTTIRTTTRTRSREEWEQYDRANGLSSKVDERPFWKELDAIAEELGTSARPFKTTGFSDAEPTGQYWEHDAIVTESHMDTIFEAITDYRCTCYGTQYGENRGYRGMI